MHLLGRRQAYCVLNVTRLWAISAQKAGTLTFQAFLQFSVPYYNVDWPGLTAIVHDRSKEFHWKFNPPVAARMIQLQNPLLRFHKTTKGNFSGEDF